MNNDIDNAYMQFLRITKDITVLVVMHVVGYLTIQVTNVVIK